MAKFDYRKPTVDQTGGALAWADRPQMPYIIPFFAYVLLMAPAALGDFAGIHWEQLWKDYLPAVYTAKTLLAAVLLWLLWPWYTRVQWRRLGLGAAVGVAGTALWIAVEYACQYFHIANPKDPAAHLYLFRLFAHASQAQVVDVYNPDAMLARGWPLWLFLCIRVAGPSLVVPVMEELFFRDFLMRALVRGARFQDVPVGTFTWPALLGMAALFGLNHGFTFFFPGLVYGLLMGILLIRTKSLGACIVAHGVTNWTLYLYVIYTGDWQFM